MKLSLRQNRLILIQEYKALLNSPRSYLLLGLFLSSLLTMPVVLSHPPAELIQFLSQWLGGIRAADKLFLFGWCDLAINKLVLVAALALGAGILAAERSAALLPLLLSKPISASHLYTLKLLAAQGLFITHYSLLSLLAMLIFPYLQVGFVPSEFAIISAVHMLAGTFAIAFAGLMALMFRHRLSGLAASLMLLSLQIGTAFFGFYTPGWLPRLNPFYQGLALIAHLEDLNPGAVIHQTLILLALNGLMIGLGIGRCGWLAQHEALL